VHGVDPETVLRFKVEKQADEYWAVWGKEDLGETMAPPMLERKQYKIGKYDIVAQPANTPMHMLRYTVMLEGRRLGALLSVPPNRTAASWKPRGVPP